jgi:hypothetical protein
MNIMLRKSFLAIALLAALFGAGTASAFGTETFVGGDLTIDVEVGEVETEAAYLGNAETDIGSINDGSWVVGRVHITVEADDVETEAASRIGAVLRLGSCVSYRVRGDPKGGAHRP